ncbi:MAG: type II toxin-antitoxin system RelE/ParE family toxin [Acidobacteria bacterium]|nr:type II toxin-antitoxin system RelE/ParE family toxin [Acidobacteriota bacterium]
MKKLKGFDPETWRYRIGPYRFFYTIDDGERTVFLIAAETRQASY